MKILGINFYNGSVEGVIQKLKSGGLLVVPSAPGLSTIISDPIYYNSLQRADIVIADSGYMTLLWNLTHFKKIKRISGLNFLKTFISGEEIKQNSRIMLVDPNPVEADANIRYLKRNAFKISKEASYIAPIYQNVVDDTNLLRIIEEKKPDYVIINLGGGVQEKLGAYLKSHLHYKPAIICTGAAIAFLTGHQATIPTWADKFFIGWLIRCIEKPALYIPRYLKAFKLITLLLKYGERSPNK